MIASNHAQTYAVRKLEDGWSEYGGWRMDRCAGAASSSRHLWLALQSFTPTGPEAVAGISRVLTILDDHNRYRGKYKNTVEVCINQAT